MTTAPSALAGYIPETVPALQTGDHVIWAASGHHIGGIVVDVIDAEEGEVRVKYAGKHRLCLDIGQDAWLEPGVESVVRWGRGLIGVCLGQPSGPTASDIDAGRVLRPVPVPPVEKEVVEPEHMLSSHLRGKSFEIIPTSAEGFKRRYQAGHTQQRNTAEGTHTGQWAVLNVDANGKRFERKQLTTKLRPEIRDQLDALAAANNMRVCEVLEALISRAHQQATGKA